MKAETRVGHKMFLKKTYSYWSALCSIIVTLLLISTYVIAPDYPEGIIVVIMKIMMALTILLFLLGMIGSIMAIKNKDTGIKKYTGILLPTLILLFFILVPFFMAIGF